MNEARKKGWLLKMIFANLLTESLWPSSDGR